MHPNAIRKFLNHRVKIRTRMDGKGKIYADEGILRDAEHIGQWHYYMLFETVSTNDSACCFESRDIVELEYARKKK
jgi:hypothetical protein